MGRFLDLLSLIATAGRLSAYNWLECSQSTTRAGRLYWPRGRDEGSPEGNTLGDGNLAFSFNKR